MKYLVKNKHWDIAEDYNIDKILYLLVDKPSYIMNAVINNKNYTEYRWRVYGITVDRDYDLPAIVWKYNLFWVKEDKLYRKKAKPVKIWIDGRKEW